MNKQIRSWLRARRLQIKAEFESVGVAPRQFSHWLGDYDYAEWEVVENLVDLGLWDGFTDYNAITQHPEFVQTVKWGAAYNSEA